MGAKYSTTAITGFNSSPPSDDGSQTAANLVTWAGIKTKLADPVKTTVESINSKLVSAFDYSVRQITTSDNTVAGDHMRCVEIAPNVSTAVVVSLGDATTMTSVYRVFIKNNSPLNQTVGRVTSSDTIDAVAGNVTLSPGAGAVFQTNAAATGYLINSWYGPGIDTNPIVVGGTDGTKKVRLEVDDLTTGTTRVITTPDRDITLGATLVTEKATTSGTFIDFSSIPSGVRLITLMLNGVSTNGTSNLLVQIGDSGGPETTGYISRASNISASSSSTAGYILTQAISDAATTAYGQVILTLQDSSDFTWSQSCVLNLGGGTANVQFSAGVGATSAVLDRVRLTTVNGTDTFDAGVASISYSF